MDEFERERAAARALPMPKEMLPCPFCGAKQNLSDPDSVYPASREKDIYEANCTAGGTGCGSRMLGWSAAHAVTLWNRRSESSTEPSEPKT